MGKVLEEELRQWVENGISEDAIMLHGTGIEALFELMHAGKLPPGIKDPYDTRISDPTGDRLYFTPIFTRLQGTDLHSEISANFNSRQIDELTYKFAMRMSGYGATRSARAFYLCSMFGTVNPDIYLECANIVDSDLTEEDINETNFNDFIHQLSTFGIVTNVNQLRDYYKASQQRAGIIIEPTKEILRLPCIVPHYDSVGIFCPQGLDKKYIRGVKLLGQVEEQAIQNYLAGNETGIGRFKVL